MTTPERRPLEDAAPRSARWDGYVLDRDLYLFEILEEYIYMEFQWSFLEPLDARLD